MRPSATRSTASAIASAASPAQPFGEFAGRLVDADRRAQHHGARTRVHLAFDAHHRDARLRVAREDRPGDRRCAAMARQDAGVRVDQVPAARQLADAFGQELAEGDDDAEIGVEPAQGSRRRPARRPARASAPGSRCVRRAPRPARAKPSGRGRAADRAASRRRRRGADPRPGARASVRRTPGVPKNRRRSAFRASSRSGSAGARRSSSSARLLPGAASCACRRRGCA